jgi:RNA polymerase subunit RPABC4/transcription elongation factor Spt4
MCCGPNLSRLLDPLNRPAKPQGPAETAGPTVAARPACPVCRAQVREEFSWCPGCGAALKPHACAYCKALVLPGERACPACGAPDTQWKPSPA